MNLTSIKDIVARSIRNSFRQCQFGLVSIGTEVQQPDIADWLKLLDIFGQTSDMHLTSI